MENTRWIEYIYGAIKNTTDSGFRFDHVSNYAKFPLEKRNEVPLISSKDLPRALSHKSFPSDAHAFRALFQNNVNFCGGHEEMMLVDSEDSVGVNFSDKRRYGLVVKLSRHVILASPNLVSFNLAEVFASTRSSELYSQIFYGADFTTLGKMFAFDSRSPLSKVQRERRAPVSAEEYANQVDSLSERIDPQYSADRFISLVKNLRGILTLVKI